MRRRSSHLKSVTLRLREKVYVYFRPEAASGGAASFNPFRSLARRTKLLFERCLVPAWIL